MVNGRNPTSTTAQWLWAAAAAAAVLFFVLWVQLSPRTLGPLTNEDGPIENVSAWMYLISAVAFLVAAMRSDYLKSKQTRWAYFMILAWAGLAFLMCGEEISWGQRIFDFGAPEPVRAINAQQEMTFHNLYAFATVGGTYRALSAFVILTGLVFPMMALTNWGRKLFDRFSFPVAPLALAPAFVGAYIFGYYFLSIAPNPDLNPQNAINEVRELLIGVAMAMFGLFGALAPDALFRAAGTGRQSV
jgi:hypothetical protein